MPARLPMTKEYMLRNSVLRNDVSIIREPMPKKERKACSEKLTIGLHRPMIQRVNDLTDARMSVCHTMAHAPKPLSASHIPVIPARTSPPVLAMAIGLTSMRFIRMFVWTMAEAFIGKARNIVRDKGTRRRSLSKQRAISGAAKKSAT